MSNQKNLVVIALLLSIVGILFSGYLSYNIYWGAGCQEAVVSCGSNGNTTKILGVPTCVYGLFMYLIIAIILGVGLSNSKRLGWLKSAFIISLIGLVFSLSLSIYELWLQDSSLSGLPACAYGFFIYLGIFIFEILALNKGRIAQ